MRCKRHIPKIVGTLVVVAVSGLMVYFVKGFLDAPATPPKKGPQQITLLTPPPPPPPLEKPPEPEVEEVKIEEPEPLDEMPEEAADEAPAGEELGVDAEGGAGGDGFGLIGRKGGRGLLDGAGNPFMYYASQLQRQIEDALLDAEDVRRKSYSVKVVVWLKPDGRVLRAELESSSGSVDIDTSLVQAITGVRTTSQSPPPGMPQPIRMRISSRL